MVEEGDGEGEYSNGSAPPLKCAGTAGIGFVASQGVADDTNTSEYLLNVSWNCPSISSTSDILGTQTTTDLLAVL